MGNDFPLLIQQQFSRIKGGRAVEEGHQMSLPHGDAQTKEVSSEDSGSGMCGAVDWEGPGAGGDWGPDPVSLLGLVRSGDRPQHKPVSHLAWRSFPS